VVEEAALPCGVAALVEPASGRVLGTVLDPVQA
jgi:hypothetical protein